MGTEEALVTSTGAPGQPDGARDAARARRHRRRRLRRPRLDPRRLHPQPREAARLSPQPDGQARAHAARRRAPTTAASSSSSTASSRWRARSRRCRRSPTCARRSARGSWSTRRTAPACSARAARAPAELLGVEDRVDLRMGTFSKSLASCGGFLAGSHEVIDYLRVQSRAFLFTASNVPAAVGAALAAVRIIRSDEGPPLLARVLDNAAYLHAGPEGARLQGRRARGRSHDADRARHRRRRLEGRAAVARALRRRRLRERRDPPRRAARRRAAAHERHGDARPRPRWTARSTRSSPSRRTSRRSTVRCPSERPARRLRPGRLRLSKSSQAVTEEKPRSERALPSPAP